jgi:hypothetical protein
MRKLLGCLILLSNSLLAAELEQESEIKFAIYSRAWGENTVDGLRVVVNNQTTAPITLHSLTFLKDGEANNQISLELDLEIAANAYAETDLPYQDLLQADDCVSRTMADNWKLAEISNYTLNPSVRGLIIEDTDSFRIYQCVEAVLTRWSVTSPNSPSQALSKEEWILFHFESRRD